MTTTGAQNHEYVKGLGATYVYDHKASNIVEDVLKVLKKDDLVFNCIGAESSQKASAEIVSKLGGGKFACVNWSMPSNIITSKEFLVCPNVVVQFVLY